jgi:hypothetical protein
MNTNNLQEMIKADDRESMFSDVKHLSSDRDQDRNNGLRPIPFDSPSLRAKNNHDQTTSLIPQSTEPDMLPQESATEDDLIAYTKFLHTRLAISTVQCYWVIGKSILSFYKGKYGTGEIQKISEATGIGRDTLTKACKFARQYTEEQVKHILKGKFVLSWFELAQSLTVAPQNLITAYQASSSPGEFHNAIIKLKTPASRKETVISSAVSDRGKVAKDNSDRLQDTGTSLDFPSGHTTSSDKQISSPLEAEISDLRGTITEKDRQIADLQDLLERKNQELCVLDDAVNSLRRFLGKIRLNLESKTPHAILYEMVSDEEWLYEKKFGYLKVRIQGAEVSE